jgi:hypothetical protein
MKANVKLVASYDSVFDFTEKNLEKVKACFPHLKKLKMRKDEEVNVISNHLIELGICDEDVINKVLKREKKKYFVQYVDDGNNGYFDVYEVKE